MYNHYRLIGLQEEQAHGILPGGSARKNFRQSLEFFPGSGHVVDGNTDQRVLHAGGESLGSHAHEGASPELEKGFGTQSQANARPCRIQQGNCVSDGFWLRIGHGFRLGRWQ